MEHLFYVITVFTAFGDVEKIDRLIATGTVKREIPVNTDNLEYFNPDSSITQEEAYSDLAHSVNSTVRFIYSLKMKKPKLSVTTEILSVKLLDHEDVPSSELSEIHATEYFKRSMTKFTIYKEPT
jgi:hypothetical protein